MKDHEGEQPRRTVNIPQGTDLNNGLPPEPEPEYIPDFEPLHNDVIDDLPSLLRMAVEHFDSDEEKELFLNGALGVLSGMMPNYYGIYFGQRVSANLYCFVIGRYGAGKGSLTWAKQLGDSTDQYRVGKAADAITAHTEEMANYNRQMRLYDKGKLQQVPAKPKDPKHLKLFLPANSTKTAVMQLLEENGGRGVMFETEGDTLADMLRQDYGNFSDVLRKAFHHEPVSYFRRAGNEDVRINHPELSVVLSGTHDQLRKLIPSIENGLFSRFCFFIMQGDGGFRNPFENKMYDREYSFNRLSEAFAEHYRLMEKMDEPVYFVMTPEQQQEFTRTFDEWKRDIRKNISYDLDGTMNRMGLICFRIAMILNAVRYPQLMHAGYKHTCNNTDFENALAITRHMLQYSLSVYETLQLPRTIYDVEEHLKKEEQKAEVCRNHALGMSVREIAKTVLGDDKKRGTVFNWIKQFCTTRRA